MDLSLYMKESKQLLPRISQMKDKVKALLLILKFNNKWDIYENDILLEVNKNEELEDIYTEISYQYLKIYYSLSENENKQFTNTFSDTGI
jgi:hypothetical protein